MRRNTVLLTLAAAAVLASCSKDKAIDEPAELVDFQSTARVERVWGAGVGGGDAPLRLGLGLAAEGGHIYAAGRNGEVAAFDLANGREVWSVRTRAPLSGGTGAGSGLVVVGSSEGEVIALNEADGASRWRVRVNGEVLSAPAVAARAVVVRTVDGKLRGLSLEDGHELWSYEQPVPRLSLRGAARPVIAGDMVVCGFDNGKVVAVNVSDGALIWEATVAPPHGRTELERLVDIDSAVRVVSDDIYAVSFQGRVAMLARETGQVWWSHDASSYRGIGIADDTLYFSTADGEVVALRRRTGAEVWRQSMLKYRGLSTPVPIGNYVAVADFQGYVHWLDQATGAFVARTSAGGARVTNTPLAVDGKLIVLNDAGRITAFRATPLASAAVRKAAPEAPAPEAPAPEASAPESADAPQPSDAPSTSEPSGAPVEEAPVSPR